MTRSLINKINHHHFNLTPKIFPSPSTVSKHLNDILKPWKSWILPWYKASQLKSQALRQDNHWPPNSQFIDINQCRDISLSPRRYLCSTRAKETLGTVPYRRAPSNVTFPRWLVDRPQRRLSESLYEGGYYAMPKLKSTSLYVISGRASGHESMNWTSRTCDKKSQC